MPSLLSPPILLFPTLIPVLFLGATTQYTTCRLCCDRSRSLSDVRFAGQLCRFVIWKRIFDAQSAPSITPWSYGIFGIAVDRNLTLKWLFSQEKATFQCRQKDHIDSESALNS